MSDDRGSATIWAVSAVAVLLAVTMLVLQLAAAVSTRHRAEAAADLAALAAAAHAVQGPDSACALASTVTEGMDAELVRCELDGWDAVVEVTVAGPASLSGLGSGRGRARAGPVQR
jgi:secretion/DNA translocation related TadE-like protein